MEQVLLIGSIIIIACVLCNKVSSKYGVPMLLAFILLGMLFGTDGLFKIEYSDFEFVEMICSIALIFIMFYGGFGTRWKAAKPVAVKSILLSSGGVVITALLTGLFCHFVLRMNVLESFLIGAVLSPTDAASVFSVLRSQKLSLKHNTDSMLEMESGSNDPFAYMFTVIILSIMHGSNSTGAIFYTIFAQLVYGVLFGVLIAVGTVWFMKNFKFSVDGFDAAFVIACAVLAYVVPSLIGGNGYLSVYILGIILGNQQINNKKALVHFFDGLTGLMQMLIFFMLGLLSFPSRIPEIIIPMLLIALFITLIARPIAIFLILSPFRAQFNQQLVVSWAGLRGASSIVFAIMATVSGVNMENDIFHIVFGIVLLSITIQGTLLPVVSRKLNLISEDDVLKTFNDYAEEEEVQFIRLVMKKGHPWINKAVKELRMPADLLLVLIRRKGATVVPDGDTKILEDDILVLSALVYVDDADIKLSEIIIDENHDWCNRTIAELSLPKGMLVILINRDSNVVIPNGRTNLRDGDVLVVNQEG